MTSLASDDYIAKESSQYFEAKRHQQWSTRTGSVSGQLQGKPAYNGEAIKRTRRLSHDESPVTKPRKFLIDVDTTMRLVLEQEDLDGDYQISITDAGPKLFAVGTATSNGFKSFDIRGNWMISVLLQELALAKDHGRKTIILDEARLTENPVTRLSRMIRTAFWDSLTRRIDSEGLEMICADPKNRSSNQSARIYVPEVETEMIKYYQDAAKSKPHLKLQVEVLPKNFDAKYVRSLNDKPGILALAMKKVSNPNGESELKGIPFVVPGARFNELYNWDSYFASLGLIVDGRLDLAKGVVDHFAFEIKHYGKILNGNRTYYLMRSQPPFLTDLTLQIYPRLDPARASENKAWLASAIRAAIREYHTVWMSQPRLDPRTGLSRYRPDGLGIPPETEASHFTHILMPYAEKHGISVNEFILGYNDGEISEPELDTYLMHDRAVRESGLDTTYRFEKKCAELATIDLNCLLFKYECDIAYAIREWLDGSLELEDDFQLSSFPFGSEVAYEANDDGLDLSSLSISPRLSTKSTQTSAEWLARANRRRTLIDHYLWDSGQGLYFDWETNKGRRAVYESSTVFWALWSGVASEEQAAKLIAKALPKFEVAGGLVSGTEASRGRISLDRPNRQWDYPMAWAPHQILAWIGLERYGYQAQAQRLAYRWLYMLTKSFVDHNGIIPEKLDGVAMSHLVDAEYGNQGTVFQHVPREGFAWTNASYQVGLTFLDASQKRKLGNLVEPELAFAIQFKSAPTTTSD